MDSVLVWPLQLCGEEHGAPRDPYTDLSPRSEAEHQVPGRIRPPAVRKRAQRPTCVHYWAPTCGGGEKGITARAVLSYHCSCAYSAFVCMVKIFLNWKSHNAWHAQIVRKQGLFFISPDCIVREQNLTTSSVPPCVRQLIARSVAEDFHYHMSITV